MDFDLVVMMVFDNYKCFEKFLYDVVCYLCDVEEEFGVFYDFCF